MAEERSMRKRWLIVAGILVAACGMREGPASSKLDSDPKAALKTPAGKISYATERVVKSDEEWSAMLTPLAYRVTRKKGTERSFTGAYHDSKARGTYVCICCRSPLFDSDSKFDSRTGWPSFWAPVSESRVVTELDRGLGMVRTEVHCKRCDAHLGHVFEDGPMPTGLRYCINSVALDLVEDEEQQ